MKPVTQTEIGPENPRANCLMACVASILECSLDELPDLFALESKGEHWWAGLQIALLPRGYVPVCFGIENGDRAARLRPIGYQIAVGRSPRSNTQVHAVVSLDGEIVHDPHPSRAGLDGPPAYWVLLIPWEHAARLMELFAPAGSGEVRP